MTWTWRGGVWLGSLFTSLFWRDGVWLGSLFMSVGGDGVRSEFVGMGCGQNLLEGMGCGQTDCSCHFVGGDGVWSEFVRATL